MNQRLLYQQQHKRQFADTPDPNALIPINDFIGYVGAVERAYPSDNLTETLTRIRVEYYNGFAFSQLIPDAPYNTGFSVFHQGGLAGTVVTTMKRRLGPSVDSNALLHLRARADENGPRQDPPTYGDNPSPYIVMPDGSRIDVGHLFLGLDALLHPRTSIPFTTFQVPNIDPSSWVADLGLAVVWMTHHAEKGSPHDGASLKPKSANLSEYIRISAPDEDLLGDVDSFGVLKQCKSMPGRKLSEVLRAYYLGMDSNEPGIKRRWQIFCEMNGFGYDHKRSGIIITHIDWHSTLRSTLVARIDQFNNLAASGKEGSIWGAAFGPSRRAWPYTPAVVDWFLSFVEKGLKAELGSTIKLPGSYRQAPSLSDVLANKAFIHKNHAGEPVEKIQERLIVLGFLKPQNTRGESAVDGLFGQDTHEAVLALQGRFKLIKNGIVRSATLDALGLGGRPNQSHRMRTASANK